MGDPCTTSSLDVPAADPTSYDGLTFHGVSAHVAHRSLPSLAAAAAGTCAAAASATALAESTGLVVLLLPGGTTHGISGCPWQKGAAELCAGNCIGPCLTWYAPPRTLSCLFAAHDSGSGSGHRGACGHVSCGHNQDPHASSLPPRPAGKPWEGRTPGGRATHCCTAMAAG